MEPPRAARTPRTRSSGLPYCRKNSARSRSFSLGFRIAALNNNGCYGAYRWTFGMHPIIFWTPRDRAKSSAATTNVQKIALTAIVDQADNSNKRPLLGGGPMAKPPCGQLGRIALQVRPKSPRRKID